MRNIIFLLSLFSYKILSQTLPYSSTSQLKSENSICFSDTIMSESCQFMAARLSFIGNNSAALKSFSRGFGVNKNVPTKKDSDVVKNFYTYPASKYILEHVGNSQIVMINEAHHVPAHRNFTKQLLKTLYGKGFRYLGCEGVSSNDGLLQQRKYCTFNSGTYIKEPQYSNMINYAIKVGFKIFAYDYGNFNNREKTQAENIIRILKQDSNAKIIVHAGWGHIREDTASKAMAFWFQKLSHINPFTINQARMIEETRSEYENPVYQCIKQKIKEPSVLLNKKNKSLYIASDSITDVMIFHPQTQTKNGRPVWLFKDTTMTKKIIKPNVKTLPVIFVVYNDNNPQSVPIDIFELNKPSKKITLFFPHKGNFTVSGYDSNYKVVYKKSVTENGVE